MVSCKLLSLFVTKLDMWSIILSQGVMQKDWLALFKVKATGRAHINVFIFFFLSELLILLKANFEDTKYCHVRRLNYKV